MELIVWTIAGIILSLPVGFKEVDRSAEQVSASYGPPGLTILEEHRSWTDEKGQMLHVFWWEPYPSRDGGPIEVIREWDQVVAGQAIKVAETKQFMGQKQKVFCASFEVKDPKAHVLIYGTRFTHQEFSKILSTVQLKGSN